MQTTCVNGILLTQSVPLIRRNAAQLPKHSGRSVSLADMAETPLPRTRPRPARGDFRAHRGSAKLGADKHNNFIGLKDVPAPIAISRNQRH